jgi:hypothetical protein
MVRDRDRQDPRRGPVQGRRQRHARAESPDTELETAVERGDEPAFKAALTGLLAQVRAQGSPLPPDTLEPSDLILPHQDSSMDEVRKLLTDEGLIPG